MDDNESRHPQDWFRIGDKEVKRAQYLLDGDDRDGAAFNIQQAVEKYLKGYLLSRGWALRRIHNLETLINEAVRFDPSFEQYRDDCQKITRYYFIERYPLMLSLDLTEDEVRHSLHITEEIIAKIKAAGEQIN
jgi:HEPN domain-containing protein